jgi:hypothetical protein
MTVQNCIHITRITKCTWTKRGWREGEPEAVGGSFCDVVAKRAEDDNLRRLSRQGAARFNGGRRCDGCRLGAGCYLAAQVDEVKSTYHLRKEVTGRASGNGAVRRRSCEPLLGRQQQLPRSYCAAARWDCTVAALPLVDARGGVQACCGGMGMWTGAEEVTGGWTCLRCVVAVESTACVCSV